MKNLIALVLVVLCLIPVACRRDVVRAVDTTEPNLQALDGDIEELHGNFDTIKRTKDPKGGFFGPHLRNGYPRGEDMPVVFCDSGPSIPTGLDVTVFYHTKRSTPDSSKCKLVAGVVKGEGFWKNGKA